MGYFEINSLNLALKTFHLLLVSPFTELKILNQTCKKDIFSLVYTLNFDSILVIAKVEQSHIAPCTYVWDHFLRIKISFSMYTVYPTTNLTLILQVDTRDSKEASCFFFFFFFFFFVVVVVVVVFLFFTSGPITLRGINMKMREDILNFSALQLFHKIQTYHNNRRQSLKKKMKQNLATYHNY